MNHNPANPKWENRDRFILSAVMVPCCLLSAAPVWLGKSFQRRSDELPPVRFQDPGHPEHGHTVGVEATTGPLGAGMGMVVGMAMAEAHLESVFNKENYPVA